MKFVAAAATIAAFLLANVVSAGVFMILGRLVPRGDDTLGLLSMLVVGAIAVGCGFLFVAGALHQLPRWIKF